MPPSSSMYQALEDVMWSLLEENNPLLPNPILVRLTPDEYAAVIKAFSIDGQAIDPQKHPRISHSFEGHRVIFMCEQEEPESVH